MDVAVEEGNQAANGIESVKSIAMGASSKKKKARKKNKSKNIGTNSNSEQLQQDEGDTSRGNIVNSTSEKQQNGVLEGELHEHSVEKISEKLDHALKLNKNGMINGSVPSSDTHQPAAATKKRHRNKQKSKSQAPGVSGNDSVQQNISESRIVEGNVLVKNTAVPVASSLPVAEIAPPESPKPEIVYQVYESELQMPSIMSLIQKDLSEPYSIYTYRYFIHNWPRLCFLALHEERCVGAIVCKLDIHRQNVRRGYIAMLAVDKDYRKLKIGTALVQKAIQAMLEDDADEVVLETEITNQPALRLYENLGFVRDKRLFHYYLNGVDALRLKLWFR